jgi:hypothetical protein
MKARVRVNLGGGMSGMVVVAELPFELSGTKEECEKIFNYYRDNYPYTRVGCRNISSFATMYVSLKDLTFVERSFNPLSPRKEY